MCSFISNGHDLRLSLKEQKKHYLKKKKRKNDFFSLKKRDHLKNHNFSSMGKKNFCSRISEAVIKKGKTIKKLPGFNL